MRKILIFLMSLGFLGCGVDPSTIPVRFQVGSQSPRAAPFVKSGVFVRGGCDIDGVLRVYGGGTGLVPMEEFDVDDAESLYVSDITNFLSNSSTANISGNSFTKNIRRDNGLRFSYSGVFNATCGDESTLAHPLYGITPIKYDLLAATTASVQIPVTAWIANGTSVHQGIHIESGTCSECTLTPMTDTQFIALYLTGLSGISSVGVVNYTRVLLEIIGNDGQLDDVQFNTNVLGAPVSSSSPPLYILPIYPMRKFKVSLYDGATPTGVFKVETKPPPLFSGIQLQQEACSNVNPVCGPYP